MVPPYLSCINRKYVQHHRVRLLRSLKTGMSFTEKGLKMASNVRVEDRGTRKKAYLGLKFNRSEPSRTSTPKHSRHNPPGGKHLTLLRKETSTLCHLPSATPPFTFDLTVIVWEKMENISCTCPLSTNKEMKSCLPS